MALLACMLEGDYSFTLEKNIDIDSTTSFHLLGYRLGTAVLPTAPIKILILQFFVGLYVYILV